jgi:hypothetical protein
MITWSFVAQVVAALLFEVAKALIWSLIGVGVYFWLQTRRQRQRDKEAQRYAYPVPAYPVPDCPVPTLPYLISYKQAPDGSKTGG